MPHILGLSFTNKDGPVPFIHRIIDRFRCEHAYSTCGERVMRRIVGRRPPLSSYFAGTLLLLVACASGDMLSAPSDPTLRSPKPAFFASTGLATGLGRFPVDLAGVGDPVISQSYAEFNDALLNAFHTGMDVRPFAPGSHPVVRAALGGTIVVIQQNGPEKCATMKKGSCNDHGFGNTVIIRHDGIPGAIAPANSTFYTQYSHLAAFDDAIVALCPTFKKNLPDWTKDKQDGLPCTPPNAVIAAGTPLGLMGDSEYGGFGSVTLASGTTLTIRVHLHFETKSFETLFTPNPGTGSGCSATGYGYTCIDPDAAGYFEPSLVFHGLQGLSAPVDLSLSQPTPLLTGPGAMPSPVDSRQYRQVEVGASGGSYAALRSAPPTSGCNQGWLEVRRSDGTKIADLGEPSLNAPMTPRAWACIALPASGIAWLTANGGHTCTIPAGGSAQCWGLNVNAQLGDGTNIDRHLPVQVIGGGALVSLTAGQNQTCGLTATGAAYCWGANTYGQLGDGTFTNHSTPAPVSGGITFGSLAIGGETSCGLTPTGTAYCWGRGDHGRVGDGSGGPDRNSPVPVAGGLTFARLSASAAHTCGWTPAGAAYCWGYNAFGQLGDGTTADRAAPAPVAGGLAFSSLAAGELHTCGVTTAGGAYCWGLNGNGQLGDGTGTNRTTATPVVGGPAFASVVAAGNHSCGLTASGAAYCWGANLAGGLGDGTITDRSTPVSVVGGFVFATLALGAEHTCGLTSVGIVYCWGSNANGQVGDGTTTNRLTPTLVQ